MCSRKESDRDVTEREFVTGLIKDGWRYLSSELYQTIGPVCPKCVKNNSHESEDWVD